MKMDPCGVTNEMACPPDGRSPTARVIMRTFVYAERMKYVWE